MITQVDANGKFVVQKITRSIKGEMTTTGYQVVVPGDSATRKVFPTLAEARAAIGKTNGGKTVH